MAKLRGRRRWLRPTRGLWEEVMAAEILADSLHQRLMNSPYERDLSKLLGHIRRALAILGHEQKTLKRWIKPAPNQLARRTQPCQ